MRLPKKPYYRFQAILAIATFVRMARGEPFPHARRRAQCGVAGGAWHVEEPPALVFIQLRRVVGGAGESASDDVTHLRVMWRVPFVVRGLSQYISF